MHTSNNSPFTSAVQAHPASVDAYVRLGWSIIAMPRGSKGPNQPGWNRPENCITDAKQLPPNANYGLAHAYSGTMALDVDHWDLAKSTLADHDIDLDQLFQAPDAVTIESGRDGHGKLIYTMPFGLVLPSKKLITDLQGERTNFLELRCATQSGLTVQDVLPPSIHPVTQQAYAWGGKGHYSRLPEIPQGLLDYWTRLLDADKQRNIPTQTDYGTSWDEVRTALSFISPELNRKEWIDIGMALHYAGTTTDQMDQAFELWNEWSSGSSEKYRGIKDLWISWKSFQPDGGITLGTLFKLAKAAGWRRPQPTIEEIFGPSDEDTAPLIDATAGTRAPVPRIDLNLFPPVLAQRAQEVSDSVGCDPLVPLFAGLATVAGVADSRIRLELMAGYRVPPVLWICTLGKPADKKSPGSRPMMTMVRDLEKEDLPHYRQRKLAWDAQEAVYAMAHKAYIEHHTSAEAQLDNSGAPDVPMLDPMPQPLQIMVDDITSQKLAYLAADRPRGLLCWMDEMRGWCQRVTDPRSSDDRSTWTRSYESEWAKVNRVGAGDILIENLAVSIYGNIQPSVFREFSHKLSTDGLIQRFIPAILDSEKSRLNNPIPDAFSSKALWDQVVRMVYAMAEQVYRLSPEAFKVFREFQQWYYETKTFEELLDAGDKTQDQYMTAFGKMEGQCGRLALVMHLIEAPLSPEISGDLMRRTVDICKGYVIPALRYMLGEVSGLLEESVESWVTQYVLQIAGARQTVTLRDLKRAARRKLDKLKDMPDNHKNNLIVDAMAWLQQCEWVKLSECLPQRGHWEWVINPALAQQFHDQREAIIEAKQHRLDYTMDQLRKRTGKNYERRVVAGNE